MLIRSISRPSQQSNVFLCQKILNNLTFMTGDGGSIMHENVALINKYTQLQFCFQFDTFFALCGHFRRHIVGNRSTSSWHSPPNHLNYRLFHCMNNVFLVEPFPARLPNMLHANMELLYWWLIRKQPLAPAPWCPVTVNFDMAETLLYHQGDKRRFLDWFACFQAKAMFNRRGAVEWLIFTPDCRSSFRFLC